jgi:Icc protein
MTPRSNTAVVCVVPGDLHLTEPGLDNHRVALRAVDEINDLIRPDFVQFIGDNVQDGTAEQFRLFREIASSLRVPWHALVGDHDAQGDPSAARFRAFVGEPHGVVSLRGFRFVRLNTQEAKPTGLLAAQLRWFREQVDAALAADERVVIFQHNYPYKVWETFAGSGIDDWRQIVQTRQIRAIFAGHTHYGQVANDGRNVAIATRSIGDPEGGPPGYTLAYFQGEDLAVTYRSTDDQDPVVLITHPREKLLATDGRHIVSGPDHIYVRTWPAEAVTSAQGRVDNEDWFDLLPLEPGVWGHTLAGDRLTKGEHTLEVRAVDAEGLRGGQCIGFMVDPTGRYTPIPMVRPVVTGTAFC